MYREIFQRNYGVFSETEQNGIRNARVMIVGCGEVGGSAAIILARSGVEHFLLVDDDVFELSNINRQAGSYVDTLGMSKVDVLREEILRINPEAGIELIKERIRPEDLARYLEGKNALLSSADDFAYSIIASRMAKKAEIPSVIGFPIGSLVRVWSNTEDSPDIEEHFDCRQGWITKNYTGSSRARTRRQSAAHGTAERLTGAWNGHHFTRPHLSLQRRSHP